MASNFGHSLGISTDDNTLIVGAYKDNQIVSNGGSVYVYTRNISTNAWAYQAKLTSNDTVANDFFGTAVAISNDGNVVLVGSRNTNSGRGDAYVYGRNGTSWSQHTKLIASDGVSGDQFGYSLCMSGDGNTAVVSSYYDDDKGDDSGSAYFFI